MWWLIHIILVTLEMEREGLWLEANLSEVSNSASQKQAGHGGAFLWFQLFGKREKQASCTKAQVPI
jgi:hypothetical protein